MSELKITPGEWKVRTRKVNDEIVDCFVEAPSFQGFAFKSEILGDDEYSHDITMERKLADCAVIAAVPDLIAALQRCIGSLGVASSAGQDHPDIQFAKEALRKAGVL